MKQRRVTIRNSLSAVLQAAITSLSLVNAAFVPSPSVAPQVVWPPRRTSHRFIDPLLLASTDSSFDFSSKRGWEQFYQEQDQAPVEWHSRVPTTSLLDLIPPPLSTHSNDDRENPHKNHSILVIGCGTSRLADDIQTRYPKSDILLLDSSPTCIDILQKRYTGNDRIRCICGDVLDMSNLVHSQVDCIFDKGLLDALLCSEGWNGPVEKLLEQAASVLNASGSYVLVSYQLPKSTQQFLVQNGSRWGFDWTFAIGGEDHGRVQLSRAERVVS